MMMFPVAIMAIEDDDDRIFMEQLYIKYEAVMYKAAIRLLHNRFDADNAVNIACIHLIRVLPQLRTKQCNVLRNYIVITCENVSRDLIRKRARENTRFFLAEDEVLDSIQNEYDELELFLNAEAMKRALDKLPKRYEDVLTWKYLHGFADRDIAKMIDASESTVRVVLHRARARLAAIIKEDASHGNP